MFAVVVRESGDVDAIEGGAEHIAADVVPRVRQAPGFVSAVWMSDGAGGTLNVLSFDSEGAARVALERIRKAARPGYLVLDSAELFRVLAIA